MVPYLRQDERLITVERQPASAEIPYGGGAYDGLCNAGVAINLCLRRPPDTCVIVSAAVPSDGAASSASAKTLPINLRNNAYLVLMNTCLRNHPSSDLQSGTPKSHCACVSARGIRGNSTHKQETDSEKKIMQIQKLNGLVWIDRSALCKLSRRLLCGLPTDKKAKIWDEWLRRHAMLVVLSVVHG